MEGESQEAKITARIENSPIKLTTPQHLPTTGEPGDRVGSFGRVTSLGVKGYELLTIVMSTFPPSTTGTATLTPSPIRVKPEGKYLVSAL